MAYLCKKISKDIHYIFHIYAEQVPLMEKKTGTLSNSPSKGRTRLSFTLTLALKWFFLFFLWRCLKLRSNAW